MKDLSLYIHIPFCAQKCYYCDFLSFSKNENTVSSYFDALYKEIENYTQLKDNYMIKTIFIGGGTPTYVDSGYIAKLMKLINTNFILHPNAEISIESNPATFDKTKLIEYRSSGINRISIGLQCWQDDLLQSIGRIHTRDQFVSSFFEARAAGFENINIDLIFGLPNQSLDNWKETLIEVCKLQPTHLSCYSLKIEEGTVLYKRQQEKQFDINEELDRQMYHFTIEYLKENGYFQYEISNFSKLHRECKHNLVYWELGEYIGFGLGAHSFFEGYRFNNEENMKKYIQQIGNGETIIKDKIFVSKEHMKEEFMFLGLRKSKGIESNSYKELFQDDLFVDFGAELKNLLKEDYIIVDKGNIRLSKRGLDFANTVFMSFLK